MKLSNANEIVRLKDINWKWMTLVRDVVVHIMCQNCTKLCFYPSNHTDTNSTMYTCIVHAPPLSLGQKWQKNTFRPKKHFSWPMKWGSMHPCGLGFFFFLGRVVVVLDFFCCSQCVPIKFPTCSSSFQCVLQHVLNNSLFYPIYPLP
jgi:hypothetical protein